MGWLADNSNNFITIYWKHLGRLAYLTNILPRHWDGRYLDDILGQKTQTYMISITVDNCFINIYIYLYIYM